MPTTAYLHVHISPHRLQIIQEITQMQFSLREHVLLICPTQLQPGHPRTDLKPTKQCWGKQLQLIFFCQRSEWWSEMKQAAWPGKGKIQKGPYFLKSWSLANPLLPQRSILCQPTALLCSDPAKRREGERFREDRKEESSSVPGTRPSDRNAKSKTRPSGNFCNKLVYTDSPLPSPSHACCWSPQLCLKVQSG